MWIGKDVCKLNLESNRNQCENTGKKKWGFKKCAKILTLQKIMKSEKRQEKVRF